MTETETCISVPIKDDLVLLSLQYWHYQMNSHESNLGEHKRTRITFRASTSAAVGALLFICIAFLRQL